MRPKHLFIMALIKFGNIAADARGKVGGIVYSKNSSGAYVRQKVTPVNPRTASQSAVRALFGTISTAWKSLTAAAQNSFKVNAPLYVRLNVFGDNAPLTGKQLFQKLCQTLSYNGSPTTLNICIPPIDVPSPTASGASCSQGGGTLTVDSLAATQSEDVIVVYATPAQTSGTNFFGKQLFRQIKVKAASTAAGNFNIAAEYEAIFGSTISDLPVGSRIGIRCKRVANVNGQPSAILDLVCTVAA